MQGQQLKDVSAQQIEKAVLMEAIANSDAGIAFLQWLVVICGWNRPTNTGEESARRDIWIAIRRHVPVEKLALIEFEELRNEQRLVKELTRFNLDKQDEQSLKEIE